MEERHARGIPSPLSRILTACVVLFGAWLLFAQVAPRMMGAHMLPAGLQPPVQLSASPAPAAVPAKPPIITATPEKTAAAAPVPMPVQLKPVKPEKEANTTPAEPARTAEQNPSAATLHELETKIAAQASAIEALQHQQAQAMHTITLMDAYDRLETRVHSGQPYADELNQLRTLVAGNPAVSTPLGTLEMSAKKGIPPLDVLQHDFNHSIHLVLHPPLPENAGFFARLAANLSQSVSIRRVGDVPGNTDEAIIARAETALMHNDVPHALAELSALPAPAAQAMRPWTEEAVACSKRDEALTSLRSAIMTQSARLP